MRKTAMPTADTALKGHADPIRISGVHFVNGNTITPPFPDHLELAYFGMGCFWGAERLFWKLPGVFSTAVGYAGGFSPNATYEEVCSGRTGHTEAVQVEYDPERVTYTELLEIFWKNIDPTTEDRQFCDGGSQYRSAIFYHDDVQREEALQSLRELETSKPFAAPIVTEIVELDEFYPAEDYHQDYYAKNPIKYKYYRWNCGRDQRLEELWGKK